MNRWLWLGAAACGWWLTKEQIVDKQTQQKWQLELQARMRPMTPYEIAAKQASEGPRMRNNLDAMRGGAGMQNAWTYGDEAQYTNRVGKPEPLPKKPILQRLMAWLKP